MSSACGIRQVESQARAYYVTRFTYKSLKSTDLNYSISRVSCLHSSRTTDESLHYFVLPSEYQNAFARYPADFEFQLILYLRPSNFGYRDCTQELKPLDISYDQIFFLQRSTQNFEIRRRVPREKTNWWNSKRTHTHISLPLYLLIHRCNFYFDVPAPVSLSLFTFANTVWIQIRREWYSG